jgi:hypothetical protein
MKYWINKEQSVNNILILAKNGLLIADCEEEHSEQIDQQLKSGTHPVDLFGKDKTKKVRFDEITRIVSRNTDCDLAVYYKPAKDEKDVDYSFADETARRQCIKVLDIILPDTFKKDITQQSAIVAAFSPFISLLIGLLAWWLYFNIFRWLCIIVGSIWIAFSAYMIYYRFSKPPEVTRLRSHIVMARTQSSNTLSTMSLM